MQTMVYQTQMPDDSKQIDKLVLVADTETDHRLLAEILQRLKDHARRVKAPIIETNDSIDGLCDKAQAAKLN